MPKFEDLTGQTFGYLTVIEREPDHITPSGQKVRCWRCKCQLCGNETVVNAQNLKRGTTKSCGCLQAFKGKQSRNKKTCVVCGREFECPPSRDCVTCSEECRKIHMRERLIERSLSRYSITDEAREKIAKYTQGRDMTGLQEAGVEEAKASPDSGRSVTDVNAIDWHLISPEGEHYYFHSLNNWLRENGEILFGCVPDSREFSNVKCGLCSAKSAVKNKRNSFRSYKGWQVIPTEDDEK